MTMRWNNKVRGEFDPPQRPRPCIICGEFFEPVRPHRKFCGKVACDKRFMTTKRMGKKLCLQCGKVKVKTGRRCRECRAYDRAKHKEYWANMRRKVVDGYGAICNCCGETGRDFLTIDHIYNDGGKRIKRLQKEGGVLGRILGTLKTYRYLIGHNFPKDRFQLLCYNCNCAKGKFGYCPHKPPQ